MKRLAAVAALALAGCGATLGSVGVLALESDAVAVKMLTPGLRGRSCRASVLGLPLGAGDPTLAEALAEILARDAEGDVVMGAEVRWERLITGVYNRRCVEVRGDLGRAVTTVRLPPPPGHPAHH